ncbi:unnamed protein product [Vitrella brassicaformis CCMP3155]|uniref:Uncharacterized protein n=2 Tax=Vitrella brassicaformis TaxID=1169539 RepID=A0A0G4GLI5_VITBC|nr:unnamed protein product [Vitrella brassicaformis CCMP3155]|mmetsp:Transcript_2786/g.7180  ORF Transcript_2786/g.7180 Transcript_2786/m.7180 type:complete len:126 (+) Transcript_2786:150-527(+)|eukprot:CEM30938.1 unnamed protein product [Vitrella brassicaformis CCMP3155]
MSVQEQPPAASGETRGPSTSPTSSPRHMNTFERMLSGIADALTFAGHVVLPPTPKHAKDKSKKYVRPPRRLPPVSTSLVLDDDEPSPPPVRATDARTVTRTGTKDAKTAAPAIADRRTTAATDVP